MATLVSVIIPNLLPNVPVRRCVNTVRRQTLADIEILAAGASPRALKLIEDSDGVRVAKDFATAVAMAEGEYVFLLSPRRVLAFTALQRMVTAADGASVLWSPPWLATSKDSYEPRQAMQIKDQQPLTALLNQADPYSLLLRRKLISADFAREPESCFGAAVGHLLDGGAATVLREALVYVAEPAAEAAEAVAADGQAVDNELCRRFRQAGLADASYVLFATRVLPRLQSLDISQSSGELTALLAQFKAWLALFAEDQEFRAFMDRRLPLPVDAYETMSAVGLSLTPESVWAEQRHLSTGRYSHLLQLINDLRREVDAIKSSSPPTGGQDEARGRLSPKDSSNPPMEMQVADGGRRESARQKPLRDVPLLLAAARRLPSPVKKLLKSLLKSLSGVPWLRAVARRLPNRVKQLLKGGR
ncbi:MAG: hypothetical protein LBH76_06235 [Propionibacteriaceae bacterium]|nr:hypothetical protein [Propionibacteriaceae bacterium]